jgi:hypothetical protein
MPTLAEAVRGKFPEVKPSPTKSTEDALLEQLYASCEVSEIEQKRIDLGWNLPDGREASWPFWTLRSKDRPRKDRTMKKRIARWLGLEQLQGDLQEHNAHHNRRHDEHSTRFDQHCSEQSARLSAIESRLARTEWQHLPPKYITTPHGLTETR